MLLTIWCLKTSFYTCVSIEQKKPKEYEILDVFSVLQTISEQIFVLRLFNIAFYKQRWKLFLFCITSIFGFEWARKWPVVQTSLKASLVSKIRSVVWFLAVYCDWYNMPSVSNRNSRSPEVNSFQKFYLYLIANYLFIYTNIKICCEFAKSKILDLTTNSDEFRRLALLKLKIFFPDMHWVEFQCASSFLSQDAKPNESLIIWTGFVFM